MKAELARNLGRIREIETGLSRSEGYLSRFCRGELSIPLEVLLKTLDLLGTDPGAFQFALTWEWVQTQLVLIWKPFLLGCLVCGSVAAFVGYWSLEFAWRFSATHRYQKRPGRLRTLRSRIDQNSTLEG